MFVELSYFQLAIALFCTLAVVQGVFLAFVFQWKKPLTSQENWMITTILLAISLRIFKSIVYYVTPDHGAIFLPLGLFATLVIGPLIFGLIRKPDHSYWLYGLILFLIISIWQLTTIEHAYQAATVVLSLYLIFTWKVLKVTGTKNTLKRSVALAVTGIGITFVYQFFSDGGESYLVGTIVGCIALYALNFQLTAMVKERPIKVEQEASIPDSRSKQVILQIEQVFAQGKVYRDPKLTLARLAERIDVPVYLVSKSINQVHQKTFREFVNAYRVSEVKEALLKEKSLTYTIESLAGDAGFHTPSSFYNAFKKETGMTPQRFIDRHRLME